MHILGIMLETLGQPREHLSHVRAQDRALHHQSREDSVRSSDPRGKMINKIIAETGVKIDIEDDGRVFMSTPEDGGCREARRKIIEGIAQGH